jgi:carbon-monoxide dehydrogenase large subunit
MNAPMVAKREAWTGRVEDDALVRGLGRYGDDVRPDGAAFAVFLRSPHAFARIVSVDVSAAKAAPGVLAVLTAADLAATHYHSVTHPHPMPGRGGKMVYGPHRPVLAEDRAMYVGEPVALIVAQTRAAAEDAAELVQIDYETLTPVVEARDAVKAEAAQLWPEASGNIAFDWEAPADPDGKNRAAIEKIFSEAAHIARIEIVNQRLVAATMEPRVATASYDVAKEMYQLRVGTQGVAGVRAQVSEALGVKPNQLHVTNEDVGGGFGMKASGYPEYIALLHAAKQLGRSVHWVSTRSEAFVSDNQGRDSDWHAELALNRRGKFLALRIEGTANLGAYVTGVGHFCSTVHVSGCLPSVYDIPRASVHTRCLLTNTVPIGPYRGAGRPEANYLMERLIDVAGNVTGIDPVELRRRNLIGAEQMPYTTPFGSRYDSGDFKAIFEQALIHADHAGFPARRKQAKKAGKLRGFGVGCFLEIAGAVPDEAAGIVFTSDRKMQVSIGATSQGQGHKTVFRRVAANLLGIAETDIEITHGDSIRDVPGFGAVASRSAFMVGSAIVRTVEATIEKGRHVAALLLQANEADIVYAAGQFKVGDTGREISIFEVAERAGELVRSGVISEGMNTRGAAKVPSTFPNGCHIAEVEIDPDTGTLEIVSYVAVGDAGNVLDETILEAQVHGGIAQGLGQALTEAVVYDPQSGQLLSGSFMDYAMPRADVMPMIQTAQVIVPCTTNPLGVKGTGEAGTTAAPCAIMNAIADALPKAVAATLEMPATAERIWRAVHKAG